MYKPLRLLLTVVTLVVVANGSARVFGQDDQEPAPTDTGTPGLTDSLDNLNLPPIPPAPPLADEATETPSATVTPSNVPPNAVCPCTPAAPVTRLGSAAAVTPNQVNTQMAASVPRLARFGRSGFNVKQHNPEVAALIGQTSPIETRFRDFVPLTLHSVKTHDGGLTFQSAEIFEYDGFIISVTEEGQIEVIADDETVWFSGQVGIIGDNRIVIQGTDDFGYQYAIAGRYFMAYTPDGDVLIDNGTTSYLYDFDETGELVGLSDSEGNPYTVEIDRSGTISIEDVDGITSSFAQDGSVEMTDADGNLLDLSSRDVDKESDEQHTDTQDDAGSSDSEETAPSDDGGGGDDGG